MQTIDFVNFTAIFINVLRNLITYAIIGRILISWFTMGAPGRGKGKFSRFLHDVTDPVINIARKLPHQIAMIDFAPLIALIGIDVIAGLLISLLYKLV